MTYYHSHTPPPTDDWPRTCPSHLRFRINRDPHQPISFVFQHPLKMEPIRSSETSDLNIHTPEKYPEELSTNDFIPDDNNHNLPVETKSQYNQVLEYNSLKLSYSCSLML